VVRIKSAGTERLSTGLKQLTEDGEAGFGRQRALSPGLVMMMMMMMTVINIEVSAVSFYGCY